jgi:exo-beta-1,3-glucanase (GH17 family)
MRRANRIFLLAIILSCFFAHQGFCEAQQTFKDKLKTLKWVSYAPTNFDPNSASFPLQESIEEDLKLLFDKGFTGIITYGADKSLGEIPRIASEIGFKGIIMGIWDINSPEELDNALRAKDYVDGYCVGNEGLNVRYSLDTLKRVLESIRAGTGKPATTAEEVGDYYNQYMNLIALGDWVFPNVHPFLCQVKNPQKAASWIKKHYNLLQKNSPPDMPIIVKEAGYPTKGAGGASESNQREFFNALADTAILYVYFEAFDQPWKISTSVEPHWGLFDRNRRPKKYIASQ